MPSAESSPPNPPLHWTRDAARTFRLVVQAHPAAALGILCVTLVEGLMPIAQAWVGKLIVDGVVAGMQNAQPAAESFRAVLPWLAIELALVTLGAIFGQTQALLRRMLDARVRHRVAALIIRKALALDVSFFEDPEFYDMLQNATRQADWRAPKLVIGCLDGLRRTITLLSFATLLFTFSPIITLILFGAAVPAFLAQQRFAELDHGIESGRAAARRHNMYYEFLLTENASVKEVKIFGLGEPLLARYLEFFQRWYREDSARATRRSVFSILFGLITTGAYYGAYAWIVYLAVARRVTVGEMTMYLALFSQSQGAFSGLLREWNALYENSLFMRNLYRLLDVAPRVPPPATPQPLPAKIVQGIEFERVSFRYPSRDKDALTDVSLCIRPGEKLALVGPNGAGKSTFIKLLTGLYQPTAGRILVDGVDLREFTPEEYRAKIGVMFQDFVEYSATLAENIAFGKIDALHDLEAIRRAARKGGADDVVASLPHGYDTVLGYWETDATTLSGGQWQKIALARAFMRDAEILIFDEPTSALDADRELDLFQRFRALTTGRIAVLISHRFSTVRIADRIAVLEGGRLVELGTHDELLATPRTYARMFHAQAEGYR